MKGDEFMARYKEIEQDQGYFVTIYPSEHFDENSIERVIDNFVEEYIDTTHFDEKYKNDNVGQKAIHPKIKLKVLFYSFINGLQSTRKIENLLRMNHTGYLFLSGNRIIDHSTLCVFINEFSKEIYAIFAKLLYVMNEMGIVDWSKIIIDGTKISSDSCKEMTSNANGFKKKLKRYEKLSKKLLERIQYINRQEEEGSLAADEIAKERDRIERQRKKYNNAINKIKEYEEEVKAEKVDPKEKINLTDRESKLLNDKDAYIQGYNVQAAFSNNDVLVEIEATDSSNDLPLLEKMVRRVEKIKDENNITDKSLYLNDKGYFNAHQMKNLIQDGIEIYIALPEAFEKSWLMSGEHRVERRGDDIYFICRVGREKKGCFYDKEGKYRFEVTRKFCENCMYVDKCWKGVNSKRNKKKFTVIKTYIDDKEMWDVYRNKMASTEGKRIYNRRIGKEHNFQDLKSQLGLGRIERRGKEKSNTIAVLAGIAHNLRKLHKFLIENKKSVILQT